jgi:hypothetical protein
LGTGNKADNQFDFFTIFSILKRFAFAEYTLLKPEIKIYKNLDLVYLQTLKIQKFIR